MLSSHHESMVHFRASALPYASFASLFEMTDAQLAVVNAKRHIADANPGFPCRVSLHDAEVGEEVILAWFQHQRSPSPYSAAGPVFVRRGTAAAEPQVDEIPAFLPNRLLSVRAYSGDGLMVEAEVLEGMALEGHLRCLFESPKVDHVHVHFARPGCFACRFDRVPG